jgi:hypothetical protein
MAPSPRGRIREKRKLQKSRIQSLDGNIDLKFQIPDQPDLAHGTFSQGPEQGKARKQNLIFF